MTLRGGGKPRSGDSQGQAPDQTQRRVIDAGWDDYIPPDAEEVAAGRRPARDTQRNYRQRRSGGPGHFLRFALFAAIVGSIVVGGLIVSVMTSLLSVSQIVG